MGKHKISGIPRNRFIKNTTIPHTIENLLKFKSKEMDDGCINWIGKISKNGYGQFSIKNKKYYCHRLAYELFYGKIPEKMQVCHTCDNRACINPKHFFIGSHKDNMQDCINKKRNSSPPIFKGSNNHLSKLNEKQVLEIKNKLKKGISGAQLGREYGVTKSNIYYIKSNKTWSHIQ